MHSRSIKIAYSNLVNQAGIAEGDYALAQRAGAVFLALNLQSKNPCLVFLHHGWSDAAVLTSRGLKLEHGKSYEFIHAKDKFESPASVLECTESELLEVFYGLASHIWAQSSEGKKDYSDRTVVYDEVRQWRELLANAAGLNYKRVLGLWGELYFILNSGNIEKAFEAWIGYTGKNVDFLSNSIAVECKTSLKRHIHVFSYEQVEKPVGDLSSFIFSLWVTEDPGAGLDVGEMVERIIEVIPDPGLFHTHLLRVGYNHADRELYKDKFIQCDRPILIKSDFLPRIRVFDPGITNIKYSIDIGKIPNSENQDSILKKMFSGFEIE